MHGGSVGHRDCFSSGQFNHALLARKDIMRFANERNLFGIRVPEDGESTVL